MRMLHKDIISNKFRKCEVPAWLLVKWRYVITNRRSTLITTCQNILGPLKTLKILGYPSMCRTKFEAHENWREKGEWKFSSFYAQSLTRGNLNWDSCQTPALCSMQTHNYYNITNFFPFVFILGYFSFPSKKEKKRQKASLKIKWTLNMLHPHEQNNVKMNHQVLSDNYMTRTEKVTQHSFNIWQRDRR